MTTKVEKTSTVEVPISTAYNQWTQFEEFPQFMGGVSEVEQLEDDRLHWVAEIFGVKREWYATVLEQRRDEKVAWAATEGATNAGAVYFNSVGPSSTSVTLELEYEPEGLVETAGDAMNMVEKQAESDLERFKAFIESQGSETGAWRGEVEGQTTGTPGVESASLSQGDRGKADVSGKAAAAGVAVAAAVGVAAAMSGNDSSEETEGSTESTGFDDSLNTPVAVDVVEEGTYVDDATMDEGTYASAAAGDEVVLEGVDVDNPAPSATDYKDGTEPSATI